MNTRTEIIENINSHIRAEHGKSITIDSKLIDSEVDSFGIVVVLLELDTDYGCFGNKWFKKHAIPSLTILDIIERIEKKCK
jgi:hypothetical protein